MTTRDRLFGLGLLAAAILGAVWFLVVSPERKKIVGLNEQVQTAQQQLTAAQSKLNTARTSQARYQTDYASLVRLGEAVPPTAQVPSLVYELDQLSNAKDVNFTSIASGSSSGSATTASSSSTSPSAGATAGFSQLPFTFTFNGSFFDLSHLLSQVDGLAVQTENGEVQVSGRLLTIQSANLSIDTNAPTGSSHKSTGEEAELTGTITATAYVLPASQGLTGGATSTGPVGTNASTPQTTSSSTSSGTAAPAAVVKVTP